MSKVFIVTSGDYSDYSIYGVFSRKSAAQEFANNGHFGCGAHGGANVEEWKVNEFVGAVRRTNYRYSTKEGRGWKFEVNAHPNARSGKPPATLLEDKISGWWAWGDSFVSEEHAKKLAVEALQAKLREIAA